ncbi:hypothetical protein HaLaN_32682, partial [Haematococcus lacustris]
MAAVEPLCGAEAPRSLALQKAPGGLAGGQCPMDHDAAGTSSAPGQQLHLAAWWLLPSWLKLGL